MTCGVRAHFSLNHVVPIVCALLCTVCLVPWNARGTAPHRQDQSVGTQPSAQNQQDTIALEPGMTVTRELSGGQHLHFQFEMVQGKYSAIVVDCGNMRAKIRLYDTIGTTISQSYTKPYSPKQTAEIAAKSTGSYWLDVENMLPKAPPGTCAVLLGAAHPASEQEFQLQEARELTYSAEALAVAAKFDEVREPAQKALELLERVRGSEDPLLATPVFLLAQSSLMKGNYPSAEALFLRALKIREKAAGPEADYVTIISNLGNVYAEMGEFDKAELFFKRAVDILQKVGGPQDPAVAFQLLNLASVVDEKGNYTEAISLYKRAIAIEEKVYGPDYPGIAFINANLAGMYAEKGDYSSAENLAQSAVSIYEKAYGSEDRRLGFPLISLGDVYRMKGEADKAEPFYERALKIFENKGGADHPRVAEILNDLGDIYHERADFAKAETFYLRALAIREEKLGANHPDVGLSLDHLATLYRDRGEYARAEPLYDRALTIREKALGPETPEVVSTLTNISTLQMAKGNFLEAEKSLSRAITISEHNADLDLLAGSERQKLAYMDILSAQQNMAITLNVALAQEQAAARDLAVETVLQRKGLVQDVLSDSLASLRRHLGAQDAEVLDRFANITSRLSRLVLGGPQNATIEEHQKRIEALKTERDNLESEISGRSAEFRAAALPVTSDAVRAALPEDAVLIEFVVYRMFHPKGIQIKERFSGPRYVVYALKTRGEVQWKELGDVKTIDEAIDKLRQALRDPHRGDVNQLARAVDEMVFRPVRGMIGNTKHLIVSPDGELNLLPFEALVDEQRRYALERYSISYLTTGRDLLRMKVARESKSAPLVIANPLFGEPEGTLTADAPRANENLAGSITARRSITTAADLSAVYFAPLGGTALEARTIKSLFPEAQVLTGQQATKAALKQAEAPRLLHIATHGFFLLDTADDPKPETSKPGVSGTRAIQASAKIENPLLRSGLALAGANLDKRGGDDGILTALEASNLNLWGTKLVTLSACDTGVGEVKNGEGVYGLRRAFFLAGTESLVMSLWPVSDYVTRELMTEYYSGLKKGLGRGEALRQAELAMLKRKGRQHPFYWASFIQSGEWANLDGKR